MDAESMTERCSLLGAALVRYGVVGAVAVVPLAMNPWGFNPFGPSKALALALCSALVAAGLALDRCQAGRLVRQLSASPSAWFVVAFWSIVLLSTLLSVSPSQSILGSYPEYMGVLSWAAVTVVGLGAAALPWPDSWQSLSRSVAICTIAVGAYSLLQLINLDPLHLNAGPAAGRITGTLGNASNAGVYLVLAMPLLVERFRGDVSRAWRALAGLGFLLALIALMFTGSRGAWAGALVACLTWLAIEATASNRQSARSIGLSAASLVAAAVLLVLADPRLRSRLEPSGAETIKARFVAWGSAARSMLARPLLGWGPNSFRYMYTTYWPHAISRAASDAATVSDPHNLLLSVGTSLGIPAVLCLLGLARAVGVVCLRLVHQDDTVDLKPISIMAALVGGVVALMFHFVTLDTAPFLAVLLGLSIAATSVPREAGPHRRWLQVGAGMLAVVLFAIALAASGVVGADVLMRGGLMAAANRDPWPSVEERLSHARRLATWEPTFTWVIGKASIEEVGRTGNNQAYSDGQRALKEAARSLPLERSIKFDSAYLSLRYGIKQGNAAQVRAVTPSLIRLSAADPNNPTYWNARGIAAASLGELTAAERDLRIALMLNPDSIEYQGMLRQVQTLARSRPTSHRVEK